MFSLARGVGYFLSIVTAVVATVAFVVAVDVVLHIGCFFFDFFGREFDRVVGFELFSDFFDQVFKEYFVI